MADKEDNQPMFMKSEEEIEQEVPNIHNDLPKAPGQSWGDYLLKTKGRLTPRHREVARLLALGHTNKDIAKMLGYHEQAIVYLKSNSRIRAEAEKIQDRMLEIDLDKRLKNLGDDAANVMEEILIDEEIKLKDKESAARWVLEKLTGKPAQAIDMKGEINVGIFMDQLEQMRENGELLVGSQARDVTPGEMLPKAEPEPEEDPIADWVNANI